METKFWVRFKSLCERKGITPTKAMQNIGIQPSLQTRWRNGSIPQDRIAQKIAEYFNVSTDYLLGYEEESAENDELVEIIARLRDDEDFRNTVKALAEMDNEKWIAAKTMINIIYG